MEAIEETAESTINSNRKDSGRKEEQSHQQVPASDSMQRESMADESQAESCDVARGRFRSQFPGMSTDRSSDKDVRDSTFGKSEPPQNVGADTDEKVFELAPRDTTMTM